MATDPVCAMDVEEKTAKERSEFQGQTYYFCSRDCRVEFDEAPNDYVDNESLEETGT